MIGRSVVGMWVVASCALVAPIVHAQDVPGIEICTVEKTMERRTSCLQSNVDFLQKTIAKLDLEHRQKLEAANRQVEALKANLAALQKVVGDLQAAQQRMADELKKKLDAPPPKNAGAPKDGAGKESAK
jgi:TolA-binding protein